MLTFTECPSNVSKKEITIGGTLYDDNYGVTLTINGESVNVRYGSWSKSFILKEGENTFTIIGSNSAGKTVTETRTVNFSVDGPKLTITECPATATKGYYHPRQTERFQLRRHPDHQRGTG